MCSKRVIGRYFHIDPEKFKVKSIKKMPPPGLEPGLPASEADALSSELRGRVAPEILPQGR